MRKPRQIQFSGPMVRALLGDRKTQTRRLAWHDAEPWEPGEQIWEPGGGSYTTEKPTIPRPTVWQKILPHDLLYVREALRWHEKDGTVRYEADHQILTRPPMPPDWAPSSVYVPGRYMPRWASRLVLRVTETRIERVQEISYDDIAAEGVKDPFDQWTAAIPGPAARDAWEEKAQIAWEETWTSLHGQESWDQNPEVVALTFEVMRGNVDHDRSV